MSPSMPNHDEHEAIDEFFLGKSYGRVHHLKDYPARFFGPSHRRFFHDQASNWYIAMLASEGRTSELIGAFLAGQIHDEVDKLSTYVKRHYNIKRKETNPWVLALEMTRRRRKGNAFSR